MALIGEAFLSASIQTLCDKIGSGELMDFFRGKKLDHSLLKKLKRTFLALDAVLDDAEEKQMEKPRVEKWLDELKHAVFEAEDLLDEIDTEVLRSKVEAEYQTKKTQVLNFFSTLNPFYQGMNGRIQELLVGLENLAQQKDVLGLREGVKGKLSQRTPTTCFVEHEFSTYGRDEDEAKLKTLLLSDDASVGDISVIPIVGMGGVGKTTLAQLLYNNGMVKKHFDVRAWACVSEDFDAVRVTKTLLQSITSKHCDTSDMGLLQVDLREQVRGKRFLFVLDDLWNDSYNDWSVLQAPFTYGARGSKVIVTTRNEGVASIVRTVPIHSLKQLSHDDCWLLLAKHAFRNENTSAHPDLEEIGKKIARKCNGLPLAAKTLGGLLSCNMDYKKWNHILNSNLWELPQANSILPSLRLSFHYLPPYLKQCFAYCSIFPKDYEFEKRTLVRLWMAVGFISQAEGGARMEEVGKNYFNELVSRSLIQRSLNWKSSFIMHDLINDLAMFVSTEFCFRMDEEGSHEVPKRIRHLSYLKGEFDPAKKFQPLNGVNYLRTFLPMSLRKSNWDYVSSKVPNDLLPTLKCSRALSLAGYMNISSLPDCIGNHIHLRYIDLSYTAIKRLPDTVSSLYNLQTLLLSHCSSLVELPADMRKLINLRHLDIRDTGIKEMPVQMGRLKSLRTLTAYVLGTSTQSGGIGELGELPSLGGKLSILNLENVVDAMDALRANLKEKKDLNEIELAWGREDADDSMKEKRVLERLQPSVNLVDLAIRSYGGTSFPNWLGDSSFSNIKVMGLSGFSNCWSLPPVGQLPALKELYIFNMKCVVSIGAEFYGVNGTSLIQPFRCLEKLIFGEMPEWEEWLPSPGRGQCPDFPRLEELVLQYCPKLRGNLPDHLPCLKKLVVSECGVLHERATRSRWIPWSLIVNTESLRQSLQDLQISGCPGLSSLLETESLSSLFTLGIRNLNRTNCLQPHLSSRLQNLTLSSCGSLLSFPRNGLPTTLKSLSILECRRLEFLSHEMMAKLTSLQDLALYKSCDSLRSFPLGVFPKLSSLYIQGCKNLEFLSIGEGADVENLTHLDSLSIYHCPNLVSFPHGGLPTPNLASFTVRGCENLKLLPDRMHTLTALRHLWIYGIPNVESFAEGGLPPNLQSFGISGCEKLRPSVEYWGFQRLVSLRTFQISGSEDVLETVLKEQLLPTTLHTLEISGMKSVKSLEGKGIQHVTSLQELKIYNCDSLEFLPKEGLPASLSYLRIYNCPSLMKRCQEKTGEEWSKIAHIPCIEIGEQVII
ncbi:putative disease resistance RPP13-like protein 1 isoform X2 [Malus sylvestris]|uniref:putative disease resistance RPP13-like protein 1 isoform X2 n=1 Tax=Malus sylvestris TaxID=3752 RepID=UPI0021ACBF70|nr:putative disease resistance RPP13-like protein 1 isoform X2 [Malus sylvestris]XP_050104225.1 putative disease resistance RPP13-like protein 1 isoform X2 [Malus sylvestris]XP_050104231.1 putative disease resistance RPP13-like protein 1 isoform X2 [Malus sylvestris]XP_050104239.1 putative disease resistance RPP13-like protein 1 isoform X2 [Malus sylvestris]XP_050104246.1 putative disease resistance RPP13-like protein 1 isoform X2 [Malus sylvestris]XP_050104250.1 putative disease resistance RP